MTPELLQLRAGIRAGRFTGPTSGQLPDLMQVNLVILPQSEAEAFRAFCMANPKPCPLLAVSEPGVPRFPELGAGIDLRTDLPGYRVWRDGALSQEVADISDLWRDDLVGFALGCSFGFEGALIDAGFALPHFEDGTNVAMYDSDIALAPAGQFGGNMVVSMRYVDPARVAEAEEISGRFPQCHGRPVHIGDAAKIGITDLARPDYGDPPRGTGVPVFWGCGVTPQAALGQAVPFAITHTPGKMLICDVPAGYDKTLNVMPDDRSMTKSAR